MPIAFQLCIACTKANREFFNIIQIMLTCEETGLVLTSGNIFAAGRYKDPKKFPLSPKALEQIPKKHRNPNKVERYQTGGLNIYKAVISGENGTSELEAREFLFSIPIELVEKDLPKTSSCFNFPGRVATVL